MQILGNKKVTKSILRKMWWSTLGETNMENTINWVSIRVSWSLRNFESQRLDTGVLGIAMELRLTLEGPEQHGFMVKQLTILPQHLSLVSSTNILWFAVSYNTNVRGCDTCVCFCQHHYVCDVTHTGGIHIHMNKKSLRIIC